MDQLLVTMTVSDYKQLLADEIKKFISGIPAPVTQGNERYYSREEVAKELKISLPTLRSLSKSGAIPSYKLNGRVLYKASEIEACLTKVK